MPNFLFMLASAFLMLPSAGSPRSALPQYRQIAAQATVALETPAHGGGIVSAVIVNGDHAKPVAGIIVHLVNTREHFDQTRRSAADGAVQFDGVPFGAHYSVRVYDTKGRLIATDTDFSLTEADPIHVCIPDLDISRGPTSETNRR